MTHDAFYKEWTRYCENDLKLTREIYNRNTEKKNIVNERCEFFGNCDHLSTTGNCNGCGNANGHDENERKNRMIHVHFESFVHSLCDFYDVVCEHEYCARDHRSKFTFNTPNRPTTRVIYWGAVSDIKEECDAIVKIILNSHIGSNHIKRAINSIYGTGSIHRQNIKIKNVIFNEPATIVFWEDGSKTVVKCQDGDIFDPEKGLTMAITKKVYGNKGNYCEEIKKWVDPYYAELEEADSIVDDFLAKLRKSCEDINEKLGFGFNRSTEMTKEESKALFKSCMDTISEDDVRRVECAFGKPIIKKDDSKCQE